MTILSAQSIHGHCIDGYHMVTLDTEIKSPWEPCPNPPPKFCWSDWEQTTGFILVKKIPLKPLIYPFITRGTQNGKSFGLSACTYDCRIADGLIIPIGQSRLASTMERFCFPNNICGSVLDKSSWARVFVTAFNTHLDPGWEGYLTVELANLGTEAAIFEPGDPLCQIKFEWLDKPTLLPYAGKYQNQEPGPQEARYDQEHERERIELHPITTKEE